MNDEHAHVQFKSAQLTDHDSHIVVIERLESTETTELEVHLGFLQHMHVYEVNFSIKDDLGEDITWDPLQCLHLRLKDYSPTEDGLGHNLAFELFAVKEKVLSEKYIIMGRNSPEKSVILMIKARVLGRGKGKAALKDGIHCVAIRADDDTDANSDWTDFD